MSVCRQPLLDRRARGHDRTVDYSVMRVGSSCLDSIITARTTDICGAGASLVAVGTRHRPLGDQHVAHGVKELVPFSEQQG